MENCCCCDCCDFDLYADYGTWGMLWNAGPTGLPGHKDVVVRRVRVPRCPHGIFWLCACCTGMCACCAVEKEQDAIGCSSSEKPDSLCASCKNKIRWAIFYRNIFVWVLPFVLVAVLATGATLMPPWYDWEYDYTSVTQRYNISVSLLVLGVLGLAAWIGVVVGTIRRPWRGCPQRANKSQKEKDKRERVPGDMVHDEEHGARSKVEEEQLQDGAPSQGTEPSGVSGWNNTLVPPASVEGFVREDYRSSSGSSWSKALQSKRSIFSEESRDLGFKVSGGMSIPKVSKERFEDARMSAFRHFSYEELHELTGAFNPANVLGAGAFGKVYQGFSSQTGWVAVKVATDSTKDAAAAFDAEVTQMAHLNHPNITRLLGFCNEDTGMMSRHIFVYELARGGSLKTRLFKPLLTQHFTLLKRLRVATHIIRGLGYLHEQGFVHRDIKPDNILLTEDDSAKVGDFGTLKYVPRGDDEATVTQPVFTRGAFAGTPGYIPPESIQGELSFGADIYAFGVVLFQLITGRRGHISEPDDFDMVGATVGSTLFTVAWALDVQQRIGASGLIPPKFLDPALLVENDGKPLIAHGHIDPEVHGIIRDVLGLAAACADAKFSKRPTVAVIRASIEGIMSSYKAWLQTKNAEEENPTQGSVDVDSIAAFERGLSESG